MGAHPYNESDLFLSIFDRAMIRPSGCWEFIGSLDGGGYGHLTYRGKNVRAHRIAYDLCVGDIPKGQHVLHACDNRPCVNPDHLFLGTNQDNIDDMIAKERNNRGERNGMAVLTEDDVREIRQLLSTGTYTQSEIGDMFGVTRGAVKSIKLGKTWKYLDKGEH